MSSSVFHPKLKINKKILMIILGVVALLLAGGAVFFFSYFRIEHVEIRGSTHYTDQEVINMTLKGVFRNNSVLAPLTCSRENVDDIFFVDAIAVTQLSRDTVVINVMEKKSVGCLKYLDSYIYFDRNGVFIEGTREWDEKIPFFYGVQVKSVVENEKLPFKGTSMLTTAVALSTIFQKNQKLPDYVAFDENGQISLYYGDIQVLLGKDKFLEDKMARAIAILDIIKGQKGILHLESVTDVVKTVTFEPEEVEVTAENWTGGYDVYGNYDGYSEYDEKGKYVGPKPMTELEYAQIAWAGGFDVDGSYTVTGEYDLNGEYIGPYPTQEDIDAHGDWKGGYNEDGGYTGYGEYDREGNHVGPNPKGGERPQPPEESYDDGSYYDDSSYDESDGNGSEEESYEEESYEEESYDDSGYEDSYDDSYYDDSYYEEEYYDEEW